MITLEDVVAKVKELTSRDVDIRVSITIEFDGGYTRFELIDGVVMLSNYEYDSMIKCALNYCTDAPKIPPKIS